MIALNSFSKYLFNSRLSQSFLAILITFYYLFMRNFIKASQSELYCSITEQIILIFLS